MIRKKKAQSILEYVIVLTAIVTAVVAAVSFLGRKDTSNGLGKLMYNSSQRITTESAKVRDIIP